MSNTLSAIGNGSRGMYYSHDTYGLGHLRRTMAIVNHLGEAAPGISQLVVSGSPSANRFPLPDSADIIKLPSVTKNNAGKYVPRSLDIGFESLRNVRRDILLSTARHYQPDFLIVDHAPAGMNGEVVATLRHLREECPDTKLVVGLRDILDEPSVVRKQWARDGVYELLNDVYDRILVYGDRDIYDVATNYGLSPKAAAKTEFVGYLGREAGKRTPAEIRAGLGMETDKLVLVTAGGGGDGQVLFESMIQDLQDAGNTRDFDVLIVGGPLMAKREWVAFQHLINNCRGVHYLDFTNDLTSYIAAADVVVSMGGYNTVCEILSLARKGIIVPRVHPRKEQLIRAELLNERGYIDMIHPKDLEPGVLNQHVQHQLNQPDRLTPALEMNGLQNFIRSIDKLWTSNRAATA